MEREYKIKVNNKITSVKVYPDKWKQLFNLKDSCDINLSWMGHMIAQPNQFFCNFVQRKEYCLQYTIKGKGYFFTNNHQYEIEKGTLWLIPKKDYYYYTANKNDPYEYYWIHLDGLGVETFLQSIGLTEKTPVISNLDNIDIKLQFEKMISIAKDTTIKNNTHLMLSALHGLLYFIESTYSSNKCIKHNLSSDCIENIIEYIKNHYSEDISLQDLSNIAFLDKSYLIKKFKKYTNLTPTQFIIKYRISQACTLLNSNLPLKDIAEQTGFNDITNFIMRFKQTIGMTPSQYRKKLI